MGLQAQTEAPVLSLEQCLGIALSESPTIRVADMEVQRMDWARNEAIGQLLPNVDFSGSYSRTLAKQTMYMNMDFGDFGGAGGDAENDAPASRSEESESSDGGIKVGLDNSYSVGFSGSIPLIAPQLWKAIGVSKAQILQSMEQARQSRQNLVNQVKNAYYTYLLALDSRQVIQESYEMAQLTHRTYVDQHAVGAASEYDVLRTSVAVKNIEPQILAADVAIKQAKLQLQVLMGVNADFDFTPSTRLSDYENDMYGTALGLSRDFSGNADLRLLDINSDILRRNAQIQKLAFVPTLSLGANYNWTSMNNGTPFKNLRWNPYSAVTLNLSVPIISGGRRLAAVKQAQIQADEMKWQRENLERSIAMQVDVAIDNIKTNVQQIASSAESVGQAERAHNIMKSSFEIGAASYLDLRDSELSLTQARLTYFQSIYDYLVANSNLELLLGNAPIDSYSENN